jgi:hypothetical protein
LCLARFLIVRGDDKDNLVQNVDRGPEKEDGQQQGQIGQGQGKLPSKMAG